MTFNAPKSSTPQYYEPPSRAWQCAYKLQNGFMIGASLGGAVGFMYGTWAACTGVYKHILYLPIAVLQSGGFFGLFLACGTVIRCEETGEVRALRDTRPLDAAGSVTWRRFSKERDFACMHFGVVDLPAKRHCESR